MFTSGESFFPFELEFIRYIEYSGDIYFRAITIQQAREKIAAIRANTEGFYSFEFSDDGCYQFITRENYNQVGGICYGDIFDDCQFGLGGVVYKNGGWQDIVSCYEFVSKLSHHLIPLTSTIVFDDKNIS